MARRTLEVRKRVAQLNRIILEYKTQNLGKSDRTTYECDVESRLKACFREISAAIDEAIQPIVEPKRTGPKSKLTLKQKVTIIILKQLIQKSNRNMSFMMALFCALTDIEISYKSIERLFEDKLVCLAIHNLFILTLRKNGVISANGVGDGTGYTVCIGEHYATEATKLKEKAKDSQFHNNKYNYFFAIMDIKTRLYVGFGTSFRCEQDAYRGALQRCKDNGVELEEFRLDRLFSAEAYCKECADLFRNVKFMTIPKKNIAHLGVGSWSSMITDFMGDTLAFLKNYFQRNQAESAFAEDKKRTGWMVMQKKDERIMTAHAITALWHNLSWTWVET